MDIDDIATSKDLFPERNPQGLYHMLPPPDLFAAAMDAFNITNPDRVSRKFLLYLFWLVCYQLLYHRIILSYMTIVFLTLI